MILGVIVLLHNTFSSNIASSTCECKQLLRKLVHVEPEIDRAPIAAVLQCHQ